MNSRTRARLRTLVFTVSIFALLATPGTGWAQDPATDGADPLADLNGTLQWIRFYPHGDVPPLADERAHLAQFEVARTQYVGTELLFGLEAPAEAATFSVTCAYATPAGGEFGGFDLEFPIQAGWESARHGSAIGFAEPGQWTPGTYTVSCSSAGRVVAEGQFEVVDGPPDLPSLSAKTVRIRFFESGNEVPALNQRVYATTFTQAETRYVNPELTLVFPDAQSDFEFPITCLFIRQNGVVYGSLELTVRGAAGSTRTIAQRGFGSVNPGHWPVGRYRAACSGQGRFLGDAVFSVT